MKDHSRRTSRRQARTVRLHERMRTRGGHTPRMLGRAAHGLADMRRRPGRSSHAKRSTIRRARGTRRGLLGMPEQDHRTRNPRSRTRRRAGYAFGQIRRVPGRSSRTGSRLSATSGSRSGMVGRSLGPPDRLGCRRSHLARACSRLARTRSHRGRTYSRLGRTGAHLGPTRTAPRRTVNRNSRVAVALAPMTHQSHAAPDQPRRTPFRAWCTRDKIGRTRRLPRPQRGAPTRMRNGGHGWTSGKAGDSRPIAAR
jgi:hypothetical protein